MVIKFVGEGNPQTCLFVLHDHLLEESCYNNLGLIRYQNKGQSTFQENWLADLVVLAHYTPI